MLKFATTLFFIVAVLACGNVETEEETIDIPGNGIPAAIETAFRAAYPGATDVEWDVDDDHYEVEFKVNGDKMELEYGFDGKVLDFED
ncbi:PepSY-like domain-containing protein [Lewinella sp. JB7]|uniref:PepSY-like domain-containing protein n=1 Tax=Lewinella sp. JB7 TaxID=2962887 RepID=UPI0020C9675E|nr:PepSY-like domain-containing protein [Lewinella sp. JB7]MCP9234686.1 PepSY-like domain-containing protein [Lewinella sp. JB7]